MKKNIDILKAWANDNPASSYNGNLRTDGIGLWSYDLKIGTTIDQRKVIADYTAKSGNFYSQTTSCHVGISRRFADTIVHPTFFTQSKLDKVQG